MDGAPLRSPMRAWRVRVMVRSSMRLGRARSAIRRVSVQLWQMVASVVGRASMAQSGKSCLLGWGVDWLAAIAGRVWGWWGWGSVSGFASGG